MKKAPRTQTQAQRSSFFRGLPHWIFIIPAIVLVWVWLSSLSFVPVPWPDDSAFYFPAKDLFAWPPRWVMIPQAPFEPSYREWNFNTMPLYPILIGLLRAIGISGTHSLKILPLAGWGLGVFFALASLRKERASIFLLVGTALVLSFDPVLRWSSVLIRPESLIGAMGVFILFGYRFGWPERLKERRFFHPVAFALAVSAYLHFNAIHLVPLVLVLYIKDFRKILKIGGLTAVALSPWVGTILLKPALFVQQMALQFSRLSGYRNPWLSTWDEFFKSLLQDMGSPEPWGPLFRLGIGLALVATPIFLGAFFFLLRGKNRRGERRAFTCEGLALLAALTWLASGIYLWHTKAEVWFTHYFHLAFWSWMILILFELRNRPALGRVLLFFPITIGALFLFGQISQTVRLESSATWHWKTYDAWIDCIDSVLTEEFIKRGSPDRFRVWDPTYPDVTIALSNRHPGWEFTRTNDFMSRTELAIAHGHEVEAMVVTEFFRTADMDFKGPFSERPSIRSVWMDWTGYYLNQFQRDPNFKPRRTLCQKARWDAFIYLHKR
jgi:hypothetical protein